jgi:O-antigen biosynthesis protein
MAEVELCQPLRPISDDGRYRRAWVVVRLSTEPIGVRIIDMDADGLSPDRLGEVLWRELGDAVCRRFEAAGLPAPSGLSGRGLDPVPGNWPFLQARAEALRSAPYISVVICTYNRPDRLKVCLRHVQRQQYPAFEVIVVDNSPGTGDLRAHVASFGEPTYRYVAEPRAGLSRARNTGIAAASGDIVAFLDDDEEPDDCWLAALAVGFARSPHIGCVTGLILPARLDTEAQALLEELGGHSKGRGFESAVFAADGPQSPLYPRPPFGAGGNMAIRRETLAKIGRFDTALGAGTPARGAEDTLALTLVMLAGDKIAYEPAAFVRHHHYPDFAGLAAQQQGYMVGLAAYYAALIRRRPSVLIALVRLLPAALRYLGAPRAPAAPSPAGLPPELASGRIRGLLTGPAAYLRGIIRSGSSGPRHA